MGEGRHFLAGWDTWGARAIGPVSFDLRAGKGTPRRFSPLSSGDGQRLLFPSKEVSHALLDMQKCYEVRNPASVSECEEKTTA